MKTMVQILGVVILAFLIVAGAKGYTLYNDYIVTKDKFEQLLKSYNALEKNLATVQHENDQLSIELQTLKKEIQPYQKGFKSMYQ
ncbi:MAG: hypothetical protein KU28_01885 [Sulfurovum sp. PC08-66]|nr:MAG: hypothetical protein KU28_01885 [Sulfurovum sp. PC08-66]KIM12681.1 MAG: hypothetical protein KU37_01990 [Sulfuricurvum sp. PC08-66]